MTEGEDSIGPGDTSNKAEASPANGAPPGKAAHSNDNETEEDEDEDEEDEEEEEPELKYATVTKKIGPMFRNGDAISSFLVSGDKMIVGTHHGNIHALSLPLFQPVRVYHAHSASVSAISISPFPPPLPVLKPEAISKLTGESTASIQQSPSSPTSKPLPKISKQSQLAANPSHAIYIGSASIDGNVCISSLVDSKDVQLRNFSRPIQAVALSPEYKNDHTYLSGGQAGSLVLTVGGQVGKSANANVGGAAAAAQGWLGAVGLGSNAGTDKVLHSGEGIISTIKWSLSGKYVLWVNEHGIKIMRSHLHLETAETGYEWKRISHIDRPNRSGWDELAGVWKARAEWVDRKNLADGSSAENQVVPENLKSQSSGKTTKSMASHEEAVVGWGDTVWLIRVSGPKSAATDATEKKYGRAEVINILRTDCTIAGVSLYTPSLLIVLAYTESTEDAAPSSDTPSRKGRHQRHNALEPELRLIDIDTKEEVSADTLNVGRFRNLSSSDYHLGVLPPIRIPGLSGGRGAFGAITSGLGTIGSGLETIGQGVWDVSMYPTKLMFNSGASIISGRSEERRGGDKTEDSASGKIPASSVGTKEVSEVATAIGIKIFILSPYDCIVALKRDISDRLQWMTKMGHYKDAWELLHQHPEAVGTSTTASSDVSSPPTPSRAGSSISPGKDMDSLLDFFGDTASAASGSNLRRQNSAAEKEKRRIGELWLQQMTRDKEWARAGEVASRVLNTAPRWQHWAWVFIRNHKFDEISGHLPTFEITPPLPSLVYEVILAHYLSSDRPRFKELLDLWSCTLFDAASVVTAVEDQLKDKIATPKDGDDWRLLQESLAKLFMASGRLPDALRCYIRLQDADTALTLVREHHLLRSLSDNIPALVLLRVDANDFASSSSSELEELTSEPISLLVDGAYHGTVQPSQVVSQLDTPSYQIFLFFYLRALWLGQGVEISTSTTLPSPQNPARASVSPFQTTTLAASEGHLLVEPFADTAISLFARYSHDLLTKFLQSSTSYTFSHAVSVCEKKKYTRDLVYLLAKTGETKKALFLLIDALQDVHGAITFAKAQADPDLWDDLLEYSMSRPRFIQGLLADVGTAVDPIKLVRRIPSGLEVEGLKEGLGKMVREYELQDSICAGVAKVLGGEVAVGMNELRRGRRQGIKFEVDMRRAGKKVKLETEDEGRPGHCAGCGEPFDEHDTQTLIGFACSHVYHVHHLFHPPNASHRRLRSSLSSQPTTSGPTPDSPPPSPPPTDDVDIHALLAAPLSRSIGAKVTNARLLQIKIEERGGCWVCRERREEGKKGKG